MVYKSFYDIFINYFNIYYFMVTIQQLEEKVNNLTEAFNDLLTQLEECELKRKTDFSILEIDAFVPQEKGFDDENLEDDSDDL